MKTTLIFPGISRLGFNSFARGNYASTWVSHGLCSISAYAKSKGFEIDLIDLRKCSGWKDFRSEVERRNPDVIGISIMSCDWDIACKCAEFIKKISNSMQIVAGGIHPTVALDEVADNKNIDYVITGEGEVSFTDLLGKLEENVPSERIIQGIRPHLDSLPFSDYELFDFEQALKYPFRGKYLKAFDTPFVTIIVARGCPYKCRFCQPAERLLFGEKVRMRSVDNVIQELRILREKYRFRSLMIHDDCFTAYKNWCLEFCAKYKQNGFDQPFIAQSRADIICRNEALVAKLADVGLKSVIIGFESGSQRVLDFLNKGVKVEQNFEASRICRKYGISVVGNFMLGIPTETNEEAQQTVDMIKRLDVESPGITYYTPYPGSDLYHYVKDNSLSLIKKSVQYHRGRKDAKIRGVDYSFLNKLVYEVFEEPSRFYKILYRPTVNRVFKSRIVQSILEGAKVFVVWRFIKKSFRLNLRRGYRLR